MPLPPNVDYSSKDNLLRARQRGPFKGLDVTSGLPDMDIISLRVAQNINLEDNGTISTRRGFMELLDSPWTDYRIVQGITLKNYTSSQVIVAGRKSTSNSGALGKVASGYASVTAVATGLANVRPSLVTMSGRVFYYNGVDDFLFDGTTGSNPDAVRQIGITPPTTAPTLGAGSSGDLVVGGSYLVAYTYYNEDTLEESSPSPLSDAYTVAADGAIGVTYTDGAAATATHVNFYRTNSGTATLLFDKSVALGSTSTELTQGDAGLGRELEMDHTRPGVYGKYPYAWVGENRVFITGRSDALNEVRISAVTLTGPHPEAFPGKNFVNCESKLGLDDYNLGGGMAGDNIIVLKTKSIGRIEKLGADTSALADDPVIFGYREISRATTAVSMFASCNVFTEFVWLGTDNVYATDGVNVRPIADKIRPDLLDFNLSVSDEYSMENDLHNKRIKIAIKSSSTLQEPNYVLVGKYHNYPEFEWTYYTPGSDDTTSPGISAGCLFSPIGLSSASPTVFGNTSYDGQLYQMDAGNTDNGDPIAWKVRFAPISYNMDEEEKLFIKDLITFIGGAADTTVTAISYYDSNEDSSEEVQDIIIPGSGSSTWGGSTWGGSTWSKAVGLVSNKPHFCHRKAFTKQLQIGQEAATQRVSILNYQTMARPTHWRG